VSVENARAKTVPAVKKFDEYVQLRGESDAMNGRPGAIIAVVVVVVVVSCEYYAYTVLLRF